MSVLRTVTSKKNNMKNINVKHVLAGAGAVALLFATPAFADSGRDHREDNGLHLGAFVRLLKQERHDEKKQERRDEKRHATSSVASSTKQFSIEGTITAVSGSTLTVQGARGAVYTVNAGNATVTGHEGVRLSLAALAVGDRVKVTGTLSGTVIVATKIKDKSDRTGVTVHSVTAGIVTALNGTTVVLDRFGAPGTTSVSVHSGTTYKINGVATSSSALKVGSHVIVAGTSSAAAGSSVNASIIYILTEGLNWISRLFR